MDHGGYRARPEPHSQGDFALPAPINLAGVPAPKTPDHVMETTVRRLDVASISMLDPIRGLSRRPEPNDQRQPRTPWNPDQPLRRVGCAQACRSWTRSGGRRARPEPHSPDPEIYLSTDTGSCTNILSFDPRELTFSAIQALRARRCGRLLQSDAFSSPIKRRIAAWCSGGTFMRAPVKAKNTAPA